MLSVSLLAATFITGLLTFFAPCTIPLLPAYLAAVSGVSVGSVQGGEVGVRGRGRLVVGSVLYVAGFSTVFVAGGVTAGSIRGAERPIELVGGVLMIAFGLLLAGVLRIAPLARELRMPIPDRLRRGGPLAAYPLGVVFGIGWTPCVSAYLSFALTLAAGTRHAVAGGVLLLSYAVGIGLPFIAIALVWASLPQLPRLASRLARPLSVIGGVTTVALGLLLVSGRYHDLTSFLAQFTTTT